MCFGSQAANTNVNPAPYALNNSAAATTETAAPVTASNNLGPQAMAKDALDQPTPPVTGASVNTNVTTGTPGLPGLM